jgi:hypothetical protein
VSTEDEIEPFSQATVKRFKQALLAILIVTLLAAVPLAYILGVRSGRDAVRSEVFRQQTAAIKVILKSDQKRYGGLRVEESPHLWVEIKGDVPSNADRDLLARQLEQEFGTELASKLIRLVGMENFF